MIQCNDLILKQHRLQKESRTDDCPSSLAKQLGREQAKVEQPQDLFCYAACTVGCLERQKWRSQSKGLDPPRLKHAPGLGLSSSTECHVHTWPWFPYHLSCPRTISDHQRGCRTLSLVLVTTWACGGAKPWLELLQNFTSWAVRDWMAADTGGSWRSQ